MTPPEDLADEIDRLEARSARDPRTHTFARLADLYRKVGELDRALEVVEAGLRHHPHYLNARIVHARLLRSLGRPGEAVAAFERVLQIDSENLVARAALDELREGEASNRVIVPDRSSRPASSGWLARLEADWNSGRPARSDAGADEGAAGADPGVAGADVAAVEGGAVEGGAADASDVARTDGHAPGPDGAGGEPGGPRPRGGGKAVGGREGVRKDLETATLAELYVRQGLFDEAIGILERLLARDPYNARLAAALEDARGRARGKAGNGTDPGSPADRPVRSPRPERVAPAAPPGPAQTGSDPSDPRAESRTESIRAFLGRLLDGRLAPPGADRSPGGSADEWLRRHGL